MKTESNERKRRKGTESSIVAISLLPLGANDWLTDKIHNRSPGGTPLETPQKLKKTASTQDMIAAALQKKFQVSFCFLEITEKMNAN